MKKVSHFNDKVKRTCIVNGKIFNYDFMGDTQNDYQDLKLIIKYLGYGEVYSVGGVKILRGLIGHFWQEKIVSVSLKKQRLSVVENLRRKYGFKTRDY